MTQPQQHQRRDHLEPRENRSEPMFYIVYPDTYWATERQVRGWLSDCIANGEVDEPPFNVESTPIEYVIEVLHNTGKFTFAEFRPRDQR